MSGSRAYSLLRGLAATLLSLTLVVYLGFLLYSQYKNQSQLQQYSLGHLLAEAHNRSIAAGYFFSEREDDMARLADDRTLMVYSENQALGMSMQYGLSASLDEARGAFGRFIDSRKLSGKKIFSRILFLDADGNPLIDVPDQASAPDKQAQTRWQGFMGREPGKAVFSVEGRDSDGFIILSIPYMFKERYAGQILAMIRPGLVYEHFLAESDVADGQTIFALVYKDRYLYVPSAGLRDRLPPPGDLSENKAYECSIPGPGGSPVLFHGYRTPIADTPCALATFIPTGNGHQENSPKTMMLITGGIGIIILAGAFVIYRTSLKNAGLKAAQEQVMRMNAELEQRVSARTADLEASNRKIEAAYAELKAAQSQMLHQEKMASIGQLAAGVAHEINNPIGFMLSNLGTLRKYVQRLLEFGKGQSELNESLSQGNISDPRTMTEEVAKLRKLMKIDRISDDILNLIDESRDGGERVKKIVQNLKSFARLDEAEYQEVDINEGLDTTINMVWNELKYKAVLKKEYGDLPKIKCFSGQLNQVFMNMLVNAGQAIEKQGEITVRTWCEADHVCVAISDNGSGMSREVANRIFEPFFTTKEVGKGTGLGLSISYDIIKKHDGRIAVDSEEGKGTTFTIELPARV